MKILDRYIAIAVAKGTLVALFVLVGLDVFFNVMAQLDNVGKGSYSMLKMLQFVGLVTPYGMYQIFPMAALLGSLMGMGTLAANSELIAMRASGLSIWRIIRSVLQVGVLMLVAAVLVGEMLAPVADRYGQQLRASSMNKGFTFLGSRGLWVRDGNLFINANRILADDKLAELTVYEFDEERHLTVTTTAAQAEYQQKVWLLSDVNQTSFVDGHIEVRHFDQLARSSLLTPELLSIVVLKPEKMSVRDIGQFVDYLEENGLDTQQYRYAFWGRFMTPLSALVMLFISIPFVFGGLRSISTSQRIFIGVLVGFTFYLFSQISGQMGQVFGFNPLLAMLAPNVIFLLLGIRAVRRL